MPRANSLFKVIAALVILFLTAACTQLPLGKAPVEKTAEPQPMESIAILPVAIDRGNRNAQSVATAQLEDGAEFLDELLASHFRNSAKFHLVSQAQQEALAGPAAGPPEMLARKVGQGLGSDAVLLTTITRYIQRDGSDYSVNRPASVSFNFRLLSVATGQTLCYSLFDETQKSLLENLLFLSRAFARKFKWITAEEMARTGLARKLANCPYLAQDPQKAQ